MSFSSLPYPWVPAFERLLFAIKTTPEWQAMASTVEDSPWHRESNVAVHTEMVLEQAVIFCQKYNLSSHDAKCVVVANLFHDFGKPPAEEVKEKADGTGVYRSYNGHEAYSARMFEGCYVDNYDTDYFNWISPEEAHKITFLIEHHLPYKITDARKRVMYGTAITSMFDSRNTFYAMIKADTWGRISDGMLDKKLAVLEWIDHFEQMCVEKIDIVCRGPVYNQQRVVFLVGPSGAGKSTLSKYYELTGYIHYSWDFIRTMIYANVIAKANSFLGVSDMIVYESPHEFYAHAYSYCSAYEKETKQAFNDDFRDLINAKLNVVVDNTNLGRKGRAGLLQMAKQKKCWTTAIFKQTSKKMLIERAQNRKDKTIPIGVVVSHFNAVQVPIVGEFDEVVVDKTNFIY